VGRSRVLDGLNDTSTRGIHNTKRASDGEAVGHFYTSSGDYFWAAKDFLNELGREIQGVDAFDIAIFMLFLIN
jgi:hypothetical protein